MPGNALEKPVAEERSYYERLEKRFVGKNTFCGKCGNCTPMG